MVGKRSGWAGGCFHVPGGPCYHGGMTLLCPRCRVELEERPADELVIQGCLRCGGVWLDRAGVAQLSEALSHKTLAIVDSVASAASRVGNESRSIDCPQCAEILISTTIHKAEVTIDRCPDHGAWYDRNELQKVARALGTVQPIPPAPAVQPAAQKKHKHKEQAKKSPPEVPAKKSPPAEPPKKSPPQQPASPPNQAVVIPAATAPQNSTSGVKDVAVTVLGVAEVIIDVALSFF